LPHSRHARPEGTSKDSWVLTSKSTPVDAGQRILHRLHRHRSLPHRIEARLLSLGPVLPERARRLMHLLLLVDLVRVLKERANDRDLIETQIHPEHAERPARTSPSTAKDSAH
jgi:hypothetical protein